MGTKIQVGKPVQVIRLNYIAPSEQWFGVQENEVLTHAYHTAKLLNKEYNDLGQTYSMFRHRLYLLYL